MDLFGKASSQKINLHKLRIFFSTNVGVEQRCDICSVAGMNMINEISMYLSVPMSHGRVTKAFF